VNDSAKRAPPVALTIAGSDSGGGAGIQADLKTFHAFGVFGTTAITAVTVQNTLGVSGVHAIPLDIVRAQIDAVAEDLRPAACKTGMLATREIVNEVARAIRANKLPNYVMDPVMVATSGDRLLDQDAETALLAELVPLATFVTPNIDEAALLTGQAVRTTEDMKAAAEFLVRAGARAALIKGGHLESQIVTDILFDGRSMNVWTHDRVATRNTHGTGCTLSAALAAGLAHGRSLEQAVADAIEFVHRALLTAPPLGRGRGPVNHFTRPLQDG